MSPRTLTTYTSSIIKNTTKATVPLAVVVAVVASLLLIPVNLTYAMPGSGTVGDPWIIQTVNDLQDMDLNLNDYYELGNDIDASDTVTWNAGAGFDPVDNFTGYLDGKDYAISDLYISRSTEITVGLFGSTTDAASIIQNVGIIGCDILGGNNTGALVGNNDAATITNCWSSGSVRGSATASNVGGLVGYNTGGGTISQCFSTCDVGSAWGYVGGLVGYNATSYIDNSYARGNATATNFYAGGLIGQHCDEATLDNSYSTGIPTSPGEGGLIGNTITGATVTDSFWDTETSGTAVSDGGTGKTTAEMKTQSTFTNAGWDFATPIWVIDNFNESYPRLDAIAMGGIALWFDPVAMLTGTALPDRSDNSNDGTITWGSNSNITLIYGAPVNYNTTSSDLDVPGTAYNVPESDMPAEWYGTASNIANLPLYDMFFDINASTGIPIQTLYVLMITGMCFAFAVANFVMFNSVVAAIIGIGMGLGIGSAMTVVPMWIFFAFLVLAIGIVYLKGKTGL